MRRKLPQRDPVHAHARKATAERRAGTGAKCACGELRPEALISGSNPTICAACDRENSGKNPFDDHHPAGRSNCAATLPIWVNDHRAWLSEAQRDWPVDTLENPDGSPLLAMAACARGYLDTDDYLKRNLLLANPEVLETLDAFLLKKLGPKWWVNTELEQFAPRRKSNVKS
jgi:hypothetical protein